MSYLLKKSKVLQINEAAANWDQTALGMLTKLVMKPISLIVGSLKTGIKAQQLNNLVMQWAGEYAKAVRPVPDDQAKKAGIVPAETQPDATSETQRDETADETADAATDTTDANSQPDKPITESVDEDVATLAKIEILFKTLPDNGIMDDKIFNDFKKQFNDIGAINFEDYYTKLKDVVPEESSQEILANLKTFHTFMEAFLNASSAAKLKEIFKTTFKSHYSSKLTEMKLVLVKIKQQFNSIALLAKKAATTTEKPKETQAAATTEPAEKITATDTNPAPEANTTADKPKPYNKLSFAQKGARNATNKKAESLSFREKLDMINEAKFVVPKEPNELISEVDIKQILADNPKIKDEATARLNYIALDIIQYEAQYILNKSKEKGTPEKPGETNAELQRVWDVGVKKVNDYFQSVIDVDSVMKKVKPQADQKVKDRIATDEAQISNLEGMNITEVFKVGDKFDAKKVYAFDCSITGLKTISTTILVSPTVNFSDDQNENNVYWFKLLGAFAFDSKTKKTNKVNIFKTISSNQKIVANTSYFYIALRNLRPSTNAGSYGFLYSNFGNIYYNNQEYKDTALITKDLTAAAGQGKFPDKAKNLLKTGNSFRVKINTRFNVSDEDIKAGKFTGIDLAKVNDDKNIVKSKDNNKKLMDILESAPPLP